MRAFVVGGRLRVAACGPLLRLLGPAPFSALSPSTAVQPGPCCPPCGAGLTVFASPWGGPAGDAQKAEDALGVLKAMVAPQPIRRQTAILSGEGAVIQTDSMSQLGGSDPRVLPTSVNQFFQFTHCPFLPEGTRCTRVPGPGWVPTQLRHASGASDIPLP